MTALMELQPTQVISDICVGNRKTNRAQIFAFEEMAKKFPQLSIPVTHHIHGGMYAREITIPKGTLLTGQMYKFDHFDIMVSGDITVSTDTGEKRRLSGFNLFKGMSGKKRAGYAHEDTRWITFHSIEGTDGEEIQNLITVDSFEELAAFNAMVNQQDYIFMLEELGTTEQEVRAQSEHKADMKAALTEEQNIYIAHSLIEGKGLFSSSDLEPGFICKSRENGLRTIAGRYTNHALHANAVMEVLDDGNINLNALRSIEEGEEITVNYRDVINHRKDKGDLCQG